MPRNKQLYGWFIAINHSSYNPSPDEHSLEKEMTGKNETSLLSYFIVADSSSITNLYLPGEAVPEDLVICETALLKDAGQQLQSYFSGHLKDFSLPLAPAGTEFMQCVWQSLQAIPYGEVRSYKDIAHSIGQEKACRAVGQANNRNPIPIFIPCHRVIGSSGKLTGYRGGLKYKAALLDLEKQYLNL